MTIALRRLAESIRQQLAADRYGTGSIHGVDPRDQPLDIGGEPLMYAGWQPWNGSSPGSSSWDD